MKIMVNGEEKELPDNSTVMQLLTLLKLNNDVVAVERNEVIVPRKEHSQTTLNAGDQIEVVHFVGGG